MGKKSTHPREFCALLQQIDKIETSEEVKKVITRIIHDISNTTLNHSRLANYQLSLLLSESLGDKLTATILTHLYHIALPEASPTIKDIDIDKTPEDIQYHKEMGKLITTTQKIKQRKQSDKPIPCTHMGSSFIQMVTHDKKENRSQKNRGLSSLQSSLFDIHKELSNHQTPPPLSSSQKWVKQRAHIVMESLDSKALPLSDDIFMHALDDDNTITPSEMSSTKWSKKTWDNTLEYCNKKKPFDGEFIVDNIRTIYVLKDMTKKTTTEFIPQVGEQVFNKESYENFIGDAKIAGTLSKITSQVFASYMTILDAVRLQQITPFSVISSSNSHQIKCTITKIKDNTFNIKYEHKKISPIALSCITSTPCYLTDAVYNIESTCTFNAESLKNGLLVAPEPTVKVTYTPMAKT
ncbi:MAG: hypothetical protein KAG53_05165 [Endozoicomonadaceae bacterium]|nr:hypothetical protein [Endozoicomonadaceae bacterium]